MRDGRTGRMMWQSEDRADKLYGNELEGLYIFMFSVAAITYLMSSTRAKIDIEVQNCVARAQFHVNRKDRVLSVSIDTLVVNFLCLSILIGHYLQP